MTTSFAESLIQRKHEVKIEGNEKLDKLRSDMHNLEN